MLHALELGQHALDARGPIFSLFFSTCLLTPVHHVVFLCRGPSATGLLSAVAPRGSPVPDPLLRGNRSMATNSAAAAWQHGCCGQARWQSLTLW